MSVTEPDKAATFQGNLDTRADITTVDKTDILNNAFNRVTERTQSGDENLEHDVFRMQRHPNEGEQLYDFG